MRLRGLWPSGFGAAVILAALLLIVGAGQLASLFVRDEPYPITSAALALLMLSGGALLFWFVRDNEPEVEDRAHKARRTLGDRLRDATAQGALLVAAGVLAVILVVQLYTSEGAFLPAQVLLFGPGFRAPDLTHDQPLPMMVAGTAVLGLGVAAACALIGAAWIALYRAGAARARSWIEKVLGFASALPYIGVALLLRLWFGGDVARLAAERWLENPDGKLAFASLLGMAPGFFWGSIALGFSAGHGLWLWLERVRAEEEASDSFFLMVHVRKVPAFRVLLRQGLWLRRRRDLAAILLSAAAAAALIDAISNTILDAVGPGFPLSPTLGASLFVRPPGQALPASWATAHVLVFLICCCALVAQALRPAPRAAELKKGALTVAGKTLALGVPEHDELVKWPHLQWLLGVSGSGKSSLLRNWAGRDPNALLVPQDPDEALSPVLSPAELAQIAASGGDGELLPAILSQLDDVRVRRGLGDPFTTVAVFSRGERQRLAFSLALARAAKLNGLSLLLDEPTSGQDGARGRRMMACLAELAGHPETKGRTVVTSHDPEFVAESLALRRADAQDDVVWIEGQRAHRLIVDPEAVGWHWATRAGDTSLPGLLEFQDAMRKMLAHGDPRREGAPQPQSQSFAAERFALMHGNVARAGYRFEVDEHLVQIGAGELAILSGPSGAGKSTLLRQMVDPAGESAVVGWVPQELARALPPETPVHEALDLYELTDLEMHTIREWYGQNFSEDLLWRPVGSLSEGERQRVLLTAEVLRLERGHPRRGLRILLMDEPFGSADPAGHLRMMQALARWLHRSAAGNAAVLVSHSPAADASLARSFRVPVLEWRVEGAEA